MFEPIHGSAPKHAGKNRANPLAMILTIKEGLDWYGKRTGNSELQAAANLIEQAVVRLLQERKTLTYDQVGEAAASTTSEVGDAVVAAFQSLWSARAA